MQGKPDPILLPDKIKTYQELKCIVRDVDDMLWQWKEGKLTGEDYLKWVVPRVSYAKDILDAYILRVLQ